MEIDSKDRAILRLLQADAKQTHTEIGEQVGLSPSACHRRIKMLESEGYIGGYTIVLGRSDGDRAPVSMVVQVTLERQTEDCLTKFERAVRKCPEVKECFLIAGAFDYWLRVEVESAGHYEHIHGGVLSRLPGVIRISSSLAMRDALGRRH